MAPTDTAEVSKHVVLHLLVRNCAMLGSIVKLLYCAHGTQKQTRFCEMWIVIEILSSSPKFIKQQDYSKPLLVSVSHCLRHCKYTQLALWVPHCCWCAQIHCWAASGLFLPGGISRTPKPLKSSPCYCAGTKTEGKNCSKFVSLAGLSSVHGEDV